MAATKTDTNTAANLSGAAINLAAIRDHGKRELLDLLDTIRGGKALVIDPCLSGPLGLIVGVPALKEHGVENMYHLMPGRLDTDCKNVVYLVRPRLHQMKFIAEHIRGHAQAGIKKDYNLFFVPRKTLICEKVLEEEGVLGELVLGEYHLNLIPFDDDLLSLELDTAYKECYLDGDRTALYYAALSIMKLQTTFGLIPNVMGVGMGARMVADMMYRMRLELPPEEPAISPEIDRIILIDRSVDMVTPLCTQLTYEGLIDEIFHIQNSFVDLDPEIVGGTKGAKKVKQPLNSNDKLYSDIRDLNFAILGPLLNQRAQQINEGYAKRHQAKTMSEIKDFVDKFKDLQAEHKSLGVHTGLAEKIMQVTRDLPFRQRLEAEQNILAGAEGNSVLEYIEECINRQEPIMKVLRIICLMSLTNNGFKQKVYEFLKREIIQTYGFEHLFTLNNLEKLGLFKKFENKSSFPPLRKALRLVVDDVEEGTPTDISYVYSGYAPLTCRMVQYAVRPGWSQLEGVTSLIGGPVFSEPQTLPSGIQYDGSAPAASGSSKRKVTLVFFIGGCTYTEISAIRFLGTSSAEEEACDYIVATTKIITGDAVLESVIHHMENGLEKV